MGRPSFCPEFAPDNIWGSARAKVGRANPENTVFIVSGRWRGVIPEGKEKGDGENDFRAGEHICLPLYIHNLRDPLRQCCVLCCSGSAATHNRR